MQAFRVKHPVGKATRGLLLLLQTGYLEDRKDHTVRDHAEERPDCFNPRVHAAGGGGGGGRGGGRGAETRGAGKATGPVLCSRR